MAAKHARGLKPVPGVAKLDIGPNGDCSNETKCPNCRSRHTAFSKECPKWILEKKIQGIKAERGISYFEARKIVTAESEGRSSLGRVAALQLLLLAPRVCQHGHLLVQLLSRLISHGLIDRNNPH